MNYCVPLKDVFREGKKETGTKAYNLSLLLSFGFPVPRGFVIKTTCFTEFLEKTGIKEKIAALLSETDVDDPAKLTGTSHEIKKLIISTEMPDDMKEGLANIYLGLGEREDMQGLNDVAKSIMSSVRRETNVSVRGSVTNDEFRNSFAGCVRASLNVRGKIGFLDAVKNAWASFYSEHAIYYKEKTGNQNTGLALLIQNMVKSEKSGVIFTANPVTGAKNQRIAEAAYGTGESISLGATVPDRYVISKDSQMISDFSVGRKEWMYSENDFDGGTRKEPVSEQNRESQVLSATEIKTINDLAGKVEERANVPQDIEWVISRGRTYILQARPVILGPIENADTVNPFGKEVLCSGTPASPGKGEGAPKSFYEPMGSSMVQDGDVLLSKDAAPSIFSISKKVSAIVCEEGGVLSPAAILLREFHVPMIVGAKGIIDSAAGHEKIIVNATKGSICSDTPSGNGTPTEVTESELDKGGELLATKIRICSEGIEEIETNPDCDGLFVTGDIFSTEHEDIAGSIAKAAEHMHPSKLWIKMPKESADFSGATTGINGAISRGYKNIGIIIPSVYSRTHVEDALHTLSTNGVDPGSLEVGILVDSPAGAMMACEFAQAGTTVACIDADTLVKNMFGLGDNTVATNLETHPAFLHILERCIRSCKKQKMHTAFFGSASGDPRMIDKLVEFGIDSICVPKNSETMARHLAMRAERRMLIDLLKNRDRFIRKGAE
ncbi:MAG: hypothetical protein KAT83_00145 [Candidatus Aenigmarchaeota archaeon]|nr:hypothetical protein [Candidatus Aenigmarchaeota archaeon]